MVQEVRLFRRTKRLFDARRVDDAAALNQLSIELEKFGTPFERVAVHRFERDEFLNEQDETQKMTEDDPFLFLKVLRNDVFIEVALVIEEKITRRPDGRHAQIHPGILEVEKPTKLVRKGENVHAFFQIAPEMSTRFPTLALFFLRRRDELLKRRETVLEQLLVEAFAGELAPGKFVLTRNPKITRHRVGNLQETFKRLKALRTVGEPELFEEERPVNGIDPAQRRERFDLRRRIGARRLIACRDLVADLFRILVEIELGRVFFLFLLPRLLRAGLRRAPGRVCT